MKRNTIWLLAAIMIVTFFALLFLQVRYMRVTMNARKSQFDEIVKRSLNSVSVELEKDQTYRYFQKEINDPNFIKYNSLRSSENPLKLEELGNATLEGEEVFNVSKSGVGIIKNGGSNSISTTSYEMQQQLKQRYLHEQAVWSEVILKILNTASEAPIEERVDFRELGNYIRSELLINGLNVSFSFQVIDYNDKVVYSSPGFSNKDSKSIYNVTLFPNDPPAKLNTARVYFPTKREFILNEMNFFLPSLLFTFVLLVTFIYTIVTLFRQKRLSEMKNDFINNMTHELKTPVSTISLAAQMLKDPSITKTPEVFKHVTGVINDETKRLSFQVEKVLQMSLFDKQKATLKLKELDANDIVVNVANTHALKVEKFGGTLDIELDAEESEFMGDEMHFTNVLFNLLDNALKYRREDVPPALMMKTWNEGSKLMISISDNGIGIKKEELKRIFERFYRVHTGNLHDVKGFGLGLAYVYKIIKDHKGNIRAESDLGKGTTFIISLPITNKIDNK